MAEAIAGPLLENLQELALKEAKALVQVKHDIRCLRDRLVWLQAFIMEADPIRRVDGNLLTGVLVSQTRAVALDSEDAIDQYIVLSDAIASRRGWRRVIVIPKLLERFAQQFLVRHYLSLEITLLNERIEEILHSREKYKLDDLRTGSEAVERSDAEPRPSWTLPTGHGSFNHHIPRKTGFEDNWCDHLSHRNLDKRKLQKKLSNENLFVIFIQGNSGVGKTAFMRSAFNDRSVVGNFHVRTWIDLPPCTRDTTIASQIKKNLGVAWSSSTDNSCHRLVVIDCNDVRFTGQRLSEWLPNARKQDKIVLITSKMVPAAVVSQKVYHGVVERTNFIIPLSSLKREDVWLLFYYKFLGRVIKNTKKEESGRPEEEGEGSISPEEDDGGSIGPVLKKEEGKGTTGLVSEDDKGKGSPGPVSKEEKGKRSTSQAEEEEEEEGSHLVSKVHDVTMGLPRAVVMLAHLLRRTERSSWGSLFQHILKSSKVEKRLQRILLLSFNALPNDLKSCFLYFAGFEQETEICTQELVRLWAAEGFLCPKDGKSMEFIGHGNLKELIARELVQVVTKDDIGFVQSVSIASCVHNFLRVEARETSFLDVHLLYHVPKAATVRRLSIPDYQSESSAFEDKYPKLRSLISNEKPKEPETPNTLQPRGQEEDAPVSRIYRPSSVNEDRKGSTPPCLPRPALHTCCQTLFNRGATNEDRTKSVSKVLRGSPYLRVISLKDHNVGEKMLKCASNKAHLRYLRVQSRILTTIPVSISDLPRLQTLDVRGTKISRLPDEFWKIQTLRHVLGDSLPFPNTTLPTNLRNLQTLQTMSLKGIDWDGKIMLKMLNLETLAVKEINDSHDIFPALHQLIYLKRLRLSGSAIKLGSMGLDNHNLELMELDGKLIPEDVDFQETSRLFNLSVLKLMNTNVDQAFIKNIAQLPNLKHLSLLDNSCDGEELVIPKPGFSLLKVLKVSVSSLDKLKKIVVNSPLTRLQTFQLISCREITIGGDNKDFQQPKPNFSGERYIYSISH
ncbi:unnamed protein product [Urochloa humidicola]